MGHFALSMLILIAAVALVWRARWEPGERPLSTDRLAVWAVRALLPLGALTIFVGTAATAAGPHAGGAGTGDADRPAGVARAPTRSTGRSTSTAGSRRCSAWPRSPSGSCCAGAAPMPSVRQAMTGVCVLLAAQGAVGTLQYALELPAEIVWIHVMLAACLWLSLLWAVAAAGAPGAAPGRGHRAAARTGDAGRPAARAFLAVGSEQVVQAGDGGLSAEG